MDLREIPGFPNYMVTMDGRVWSCKRTTTKGGWIASFRDKNGYYEFILRRNGIPIHKRAHCIVLETYVGPRPDGMITRHLNGDLGDNRLSNLCWGTPKENMQDSIKHGTAFWGPRCSGKNNPNSKLCEEQVRVIFHAYHDGTHIQQELADHFEVSRSCVQDIVEKKNWSYLWND